MKAPDKIYLPIIEDEGRKLLCTCWWEEDTSSRNAYVNETVQYIRKDTLLEWLNEMLKSTAESFRFSENQTYGKVIDKINTL